MPLMLAAALVAVTTVQPSCSWDRPGANPYTGRPEAAIDRYTDIPAQVRNTLKMRIAERQSDDTVSITRDGIQGRDNYDPAIRDMHFGAATVCNSVSRSKWSAQRIEPAAVYCVGEHCILVPKICGNVSRISRLSKAPPAAPSTKRAGDAPTTQARDLGDSLNSRDLGLADADPRERPDAATTDDAQADSDKLKRDAANDAIRQAKQGGAAEYELPPGDDSDDAYGRNRLAGFGHYPNLFPDPDTLYLPDAGMPPGAPGPNGNPTPVPEADSWLMLSTGLTLLGLVSRLSRRARRKPA